MRESSIPTIENERKMASTRRQEVSSVQQLSGWKVLERGAVGKLLQRSHVRKTIRLLFRPGVNFHPVLCCLYEECKVNPRALRRGRASTPLLTFLEARECQRDEAAVTVAPRSNEEAEKRNVCRPEINKQTKTTAWSASCGLKAPPTGRKIRSLR